MYFNKLEIHGFKSFAEPVTIEFDRGITCVVGPNGSGKSNICDALRWVLGSQSARELRGDKMEDIIFAGSSDRKSRGMAEVSLFIDNEDGELPIEYNEVVITRRLYRSGESEYFINNNRCRMRDIRNLIMDTGIGVEGYSIIGQGRISDIISNDTESIREILEETAGISMYRSKKAQSERKLKSASGNMDRVNDIIGEIEGRIDGLKSDSEKAREFLDLRERHKHLEINITLKNIESLERRNKEITDDLDALTKTLRENDEKRNAIIDSLSKNGEQRQALDVLIEENRSGELKLVEEINALTNKKELNKERIAAIERTGARLAEEIEELKAKIAREEENSGELFKEREEVHKKAQELNDALDEKLKVYEERKEKLSALGSGIDEKKSLLFDLQTKISNAGAEIISIENLKETLERRKETVLRERGTGEGLKESREKLVTAEREKSETQDKLDSLKKELNDLTVAGEEGRRREKLLTEESENIKIEMGRLAARKRTFEEMEASYEGFNNAVKFIMREDIKGIEGTVADIIEVPRGLETAIETALGGAVQNVVCADDGVAKEAIVKLREEKAGRLTFLPVKSIDPRGVLMDTKVERADGFEGYAADMVECDERYDRIVEYLLGNVCVMTDMDAAIAASKEMDRNIKLVTLEGEIVNKAGAITGGRGKHRTGNILERKAEIGILEQELDDKKADQQRKESELEALRKKLAEDARTIETKRDEIRQLEIDVMSKDNDITIIKTALGDMEDSARRWEKELQNIDEEMKNSSDILEEKKKETDSAKAEKLKLEDEIEKESAIYEEQSTEFSQFSDEITKARIDASAHESEKNRIDAIAGRVRQSIDEYAKEISAKQEQTEQIKKEKETLISDEVAGENAEEKIRLKDETVKKLAELRGEKEALLLEISKDNEAKESLDADMEKFRSQKSELEIKQARQETQLENAKNKLWEEFDVSYMQALEYKNEDFVMSKSVHENREIKKRMKELGEVNIGAIEEYANVKERYEFLTGQRQDIEKSMNELEEIISDMDKIIRARFKGSFDSVVSNFEEVFRELYGGGHANISLADENDPFDSEIEITAQPPGKQLKHINLLSGGEKTMTAIALMFAVLKTKPTPCCILDEIEAALDDSNLEIFGNYIKNFDNVQFTLITHQKATMEHADVMYGITMPENGVSKVYSLKLDGSVDTEAKNVG